MPLDSREVDYLKIAGLDSTLEIEEIQAKLFVHVQQTTRADEIKLNSESRQRIPLILRALPQELFQAAINAGVTAESDIDHCCKTLIQLVSDQRKQSLTQELVYQDQKAGDGDEEYARNLQHLAERAYRGSPLSRVTNWVTAQFRAGVRSPTITVKLHAVNTNGPNQIVEAVTRKRQ
ncbi:hypothetical protein TSMEX_008521 [Taenia solium]|eukprot:TsM_000074100 transcript=TsM_000074100 gene=TsM_000074100